MKGKEHRVCLFVCLSVCTRLTSSFCGLELFFAVPSRVQEWLRSVTPYFVPEEIPEEDSEREDVGVDFPAKRVEEESLCLVQRNLLRRKLQHAKNTLQWNRQSSEKRLKGSERAASPQSSDSSGHTTRHSSYQSAAPLRRGQSKERLSRHTTRNSQHSAVSPMRPQLKERLSSSDGNSHTTRYSNRSAVSLLRRQLKERLSSSEGSSHDSAFSLTRRQLKERLSYNYCLKQCVRGERLVTSLTVPSQQVQYSCMYSITVILYFVVLCLETCSFTG